MTVRIPDDLGSFVDGQVAAGTASSRAEAIATALRHERRRIAAERDAEIYATTQPDSEIEGFLGWTSAHPVTLDL